MTTYTDEPPAIADKIARGVDVTIEAIYRADEIQRTLDRETAALKTTDDPEARIRAFERIIRAALSGAGILLSEQIVEMRRAAPPLEEIEIRAHHAKNIGRALRTHGDAIRGYVRDLDEIKGGAVTDIHARLEQHGVTRIAAPPDQYPSYSHAVGSLYSDLVVEITPQLPAPAAAAGPPRIVLAFAPESRTYGVDIYGISFTCGPGDFIDLKQTGAKTIHGRRCSVGPPCLNERCTYYHDPRVTPSRFSPLRNIVIGYAVLLLSVVKDDESMRTDARARNIDYVRDLIQLGGIIFYKAEQLLARHFKKKTIQRRGAGGGITRPSLEITSPVPQPTIKLSGTSRMLNMI